MTLFLLAIYIGLLAILCISEHSDNTATIRSFKDAFWYSLVTLTTVGYGDLTPVTPLGKAVGVIFLLMSAGIMMTLFGAAVSFVTSEGLPFFLLSLQREKNWYYFADCGVEPLLSLQIFIAKNPTQLLFLEKKQMIIPNFQIFHACLSMLHQRKL